jgi:hypothetical protein
MSSIPPVRLSEGFDCLSDDSALACAGAPIEHRRLGLMISLQRLKKILKGKRTPRLSKRNQMLTGVFDHPLLQYCFREEPHGS